MAEELPPLGQVVAWHEGRKSELKGLGIEAELVGPSAGYSKNVVALHIIAADRLIGVEVWDSGECDVSVTMVEGEAETKWTAYGPDLKRNLPDLLDRLIEGLLQPTDGTICPAL